MDGLEATRSVGKLPLVTLDANDGVSMKSLELDGHLKEVKEFCVRQKIVPSSFFKAAWSVVLSQLTERDWVSFGFMDLDRNPQSQLCQEVHPIQASITTETSLDSLLGGECFSTQGQPDETVPTYNSALYTAEETEIVDVGKLLQSSTHENLDIMLLVSLGGVCCPKGIQVIYRCSAFSNFELENLCSLISSVISSLLGDLNRQIQDLYLFSETNKRDVLQWNTKKWNLGGKSQSVLDFIHQRATENPNEIAICSWDAELTYEELEQTILKLASYLKEIGVKAQVMVPITFEKSSLAILAELAVMKAGGAFVPVDPSLPSDRVKYMVNETQATIGLASTKYSPQMGTHVKTVISISHDFLTSLTVSPNDSLPPASLDSPAYVLFTSGSTGQPKGCVMAHGALATVASQAPSMDIRRESRVLQFASFSFAASIIEIYFTLTAGGTICIPSDDDRLSRLSTVMHEMRVSWAMLTPSAMSTLADPANVPLLKTLISVGESLGRHQCGIWAKDVQLYEALGCSEYSGIICVSKPMASEEDCRIVGCSASANLWVVNPNNIDIPTPVGVVGELCIDGPALATGYLNDPVRTKSAFVEKPQWMREINDSSAKTIYKTGDLVQYVAGGHLRYIARKDTQVKIRGQRVELGEVEFKIRQACSKIDSVLVEAGAPSNGNGSKILVAFLFSNDFIHGEPESAEFPALGDTSVAFRAYVQEIIALISQSLPPYMQPSVYLPLRHVPKTLTGKTDRKLLRAMIPQFSRSELEQYQSTPVSIVAPTTELEKTVHSMVSDILQLKPSEFGVHESFISLGGDSVIAMRLANSCLLAGLPLSASTILEKRTVAAMAMSLENTDETTDGSKVVQASPLPQDLRSRLIDPLGLDQDSVEDVYACSAIQQGMLLSQLRDRQLYQARMLWEIRLRENEALDVTRLQNAWYKLCSRHSILRTQVCTDYIENGTTYQVVRRDTPNEVFTVSEAAASPMRLSSTEADNDHYTDLPHVTCLTGCNPMRIVIDINHLLMEGLSVSIMMRDLEILYDHDDDHAQSFQALGPVSNYHDYVTYLAEQQSEKSLEFWRSRLSDVSSCIFPSLIDSHAIIPDQELRSHSVPLGELSLLQEICQTNNVTLASLFKMAWGLLLRCYTGSETVCFGDSVSGRDNHLSGAHNAIGPYLHENVCQIAFDGNTSVSEMLRSIHTDFVSTLPHKHVPLADIQHAIGIGETRLFNTGLSCLPAISSHVSGEGSITISEIDRVCPTEYDVVLEVHVHRESVQGIFKYWSQSLDDQQARRLGSTLQKIVSELIRCSGLPCKNGLATESPNDSQQNCSIRDLQIISAQDLQDIWTWNGSIPETDHACVHSVISRNVIESPTAEAVCAWDGNLTYQELDTLSTKFAHRLTDLGVRPGSIVPLCFEKSVWMPVAVLAVMKAGGASVALDISQPLERLQSITEQVKAAIIVCSNAQYGIASQLGVVTVCTLDRKSVTEISLPAEIKLPSVQPTDLLYMVFTSGSTGTPKGVMISHQNFCSAIKYHQSAMGITSSSRVFDFVTYAFDIAWSNILHSMTVGACLCIPHEDDRHSNISKCANSMRVNYAFVTPTVARLMNPSEIPTLRTLLCGGELLTEADVHRWTPQVDLRNTYGPAECTVISNAKSVNPHRIGNPGLGKGVGCNLWIVDPDSDSQLMPVGCTGELWIEGPIVGNGYLGDPAKTAATFINNVNWPSPTGRHDRESRLYKTGDLVRYDPSGNIVFVRRKDGQAKVRGQRVELAEVEYHVHRFLQGTTLSGVVAEVIQPTGGSSEILVVFLPVGDEVDEDGIEILNNAHSQMILRQSTSGLLEELRSKIPSSMIPAAIIPLSRIPATANGKTDRQKLRQIGSLISLEELAELNPSRLGYREPRTDMERALQHLWADVLKISPQSIGARDSFLQIGGDSVGIMRLVGKASEQNLSFSVAQVFQNPRLEDLALVAVQAESKEEKVMPFSLLGAKLVVTEACAQAAQQCHVMEIEIEDLYPCTPLQEGLMSLSSYNSDYIDRRVMELKHDVDLDRFQTAWERVIAVEPILRTRIVNLKGQGLMQVVVNQPVAVQRASDLKSYLTGDSNEPMGLGARLARFALIKMPHGDETGKSYFVLTLHHAVYDAFSMSLILEQFVALYNDHSPKVHTPFQNFIKQIMQKDPQVDEYWKSQLVGPATGPFPDLPNAKYQPHADETFKYSISGLQWLPRDITLPTVIRAAWTILTAHYTNVPNVVFGAILSGRQIPLRGIEKVAGPTIATVPVYVSFDWGASVESLMEKLQKQAVDMTNFEQTGLQNIRKISPEVKETSQFETLLIILPTTQDSDDALQGQIFERGESERQSITEFTAFSTYALNLLVQLKEGGVELLISYDSHVIDSAQAQRIMRQFHHILGQLTTQGNYNRPISEIGAASSDDIETIWTWNADVPPASERCVHELISQHAERNPESPAICAWNGSLSYRELDERSTRLSQHLTSLGVASGSIVPLYIEKSVWMPVAQLAVMKTGAASVALDVYQPAARLESILQQVQPSVIIASTTQDLTNARQLFPSCVVVTIDEEFLSSLPTLLDSDLPLVQSSSPVYVVFTSGSTGTPKGVVITHMNISSAMFHQAGHFELSPGSRVFDFASYSFDISWLNFCKTLTSGQCLCIPSETDRKNDIAGSISRLDANFACLTASVARMIHPDQVPSLKTLVLAGETPTANDYLSWAAVTDLRNGYGPAECTPLSTATGPATQTSTPANVGFGMGLNTWIVDQTNSDVLAPIGSVGELWLEGPLVGYGYHLDPEKTLIAFKENPLWLQQGSRNHPGREGRLYKTGDLVRYNDNGSLTFVGRKDTQVKIKGQRVELNEVEHHVQQSISSGFCGSVAAEVIVPAGQHEPILAAFLSMEENDCQDPAHTMSYTEGLVDKLTQKLPMYMIPKVFIPIPEIPRTTTGKVDYRALRALGSSYSLEQLAESNPAREYREPVTEVQRKLQKLWATTLNVSPQTISASDSFLEIGGDSIAAMQLVSIARDQGELSFTVADVFRYPRLEDLAQNIRLVHERDVIISPFSLLGEAKDEIIQLAANRCGVTTDEIEDVYPCTPLQEGMMSSTSRRAGEYINRNIFELRDTVDATKLKETWALIVEENPILRTRIVDIPLLGLMQVVLAETMSWSTSDNLSLYLAADKEKSMDLSSPLARFCFVEEGEHRYIVVTLHHAVYDGWSMALVIDSIEKAFFQESRPELYPFRHFINSSSQSPERISSFWRDQFAGIQAEPFPSLPSASYHPQANSTFTQKVTGLNWPSSGITPSILLRAAWALLTSHYHQPTEDGSKEALFGVTLSGRQGATRAVEKVVGPTIATVPVRVQVPQGITIRAFLDKLQRQSVDMIEFEQTGLQNIRQINDDGLHATRFQSLLVVQPVGSSEHYADNRLFKPTSEETAKGYITMLKSFSSYSILLLLQLHDDGVDLIFSFDSEVFSDGQVERLSCQMSHVLTQLCHLKPNELENPLESIQLLSPTDKIDLRTWNSKAISSTDDVCVHEAISSHALRHATTQAISAWDGDLSYGDLEEMSTKIAHVLSGPEFGVRPLDIVGLHFEKSMWMPVFMIALLKLGSTVVQLSSSITQSRIEAISSTVSPKLILTNLDIIPVGNALTVSASQVIENSRKIDLGPIRIMANRNGCAHILFTSGSSGVPKGIAWTHHALAANVKAISTLKMSAGCRVFQFVSYDFDVSIIETYAALVNGACLCIPSEADRVNNPALAMARMDATWISLTPSTASMINPDNIPSLETCVFAGEALPQSVVDSWSRACTIFNWYGPAECSTAISCPVTGENSNWKSGVIGSPLASLCWIVDPSNSDILLPVGAVGELLLEGPPLMIGYVGNSKTTGHFLTPKWLTPYSETPQNGACQRRDRKLYRTGDLVRYQSNGMITFVGRKDSQVKIRGQRVELSEVEAHLRQIIPGDLSASVAVDILRRDSSDPVLAAFIATEDVRTLKESLMTIDVREELLNRLPRYMVPSAYIPVDSIPLTTNGKVNRSKLRQLGDSYTPEQLTALNASDGEYRKPATTAEVALQMIWTQVLGITPQRACDHFLQMGGDSVSAMKLVAAARDGGFALSVSDVFKHPRLEKLAEQMKPAQSSPQMIPSFSLLPKQITATEAKAQAADLCGVSIAKIENLYPCTTLQQGMISLTVRRSGDYVNRSAIDLHPHVDPSRLEKAWKSVIRQTPILRTRIVDLPNLGLFQVVLIDEEHANWFSSDDMDSYMIADKKIEMGLGTPLARFALVTEQTAKTTSLALTLHHALYDGWCFPQILDAVQHEYYGTGATPTLLPFDMFIKYCDRLSDDPMVQSFWQNQFINLAAEPFPSLPTPGHQPKADQTYQHEMCGIRWPKTGITPSSIIRTAWTILSARYQSTTDVIFGATVTGRQAPIAGIEKIIGPTIATVPIRVNFSWDDSVQGLLEQVQDQGISMVDFEQTGLQNIQQFSTEAETATKFQSLLVVQPDSYDRKTTTDYRDLIVPLTEEQKSKSVAVYNSFSTYAIMLIVQLKKNGEVGIYVSFDSKVMDRLQIQRVTQQMEHIIRQLCAENSNQQVSDIKAASTQDLIDIWGWNSRIPAIEEVSVPELIARRVLQCPDKIAIDAWDGKMTYAGMAQAATDLAHRFRRLGLQRTDAVGLHFEKSMWMPIAMMAALQVGAVVLQFSEAQTEARLNTIFSTLPPRFVVTNVKNVSYGIIHGHQIADILHGSVSDPELNVVDDISLLDDSPSRLQDPAHIIFTSGSTGVPKGMVWLNSSLTANVQILSRKFKMSERTRVFQFVSYDFDVSNMEMYATFVSGGCLCVPNEADRISHTSSTMARFESSWVFFTPSASEMLHPAEVPSLETIVFGGEKLSTAHVERFIDHASVFNWYGPGEASLATSCSIELEKWTPGLIGQPLASSIWVVDSADTEVLLPIGAVGELLVYSPSLMSDYVKGTASSTDHFVKPQWLAQGMPDYPPQNVQLYRTGDLVRYLSDGSLVYVGRKDAQVKIRGQRVELTDIEAHIRSSLLERSVDIPVVVDIISPSQSSDPLLAAFIPIGDSADASMDERRESLSALTCGLREQLARLLPRHMIPGSCIPVKQIPLTANGKADRRSLRAVGASYTLEQLAQFNPDRSQERSEPTTKTESAMRELWASTLKLSAESIGTRDSFLQIGGDSIGAMRLVGIARKKGLLITVADIFQHPRLDELARCVKYASPTDEEDQIAPFSLLPLAFDTEKALTEAARQCNVSSVEIEDIYPCTALQEGLLALTQIRPGDYVSCSVRKLHPNVDIQRLKEALHGFITRLPILRTRIVDLPGIGLVQVVLSSNKALWSDGLDIDDFHQQQAAEPMTLGTSLSRFVFIGRGDASHLGWAIHHALYDGWSMPLMLEQLTSLYLGVATPTLTHFSQFIRYLRSTESCSSEFWKAQLEDSEAPPFPEMPSMGYEPHANELVRVSLPKIKWPATDITASTVIRAAWALLTSQFSASPDTIFGATMTGRQIPVSGVERMAGPTITTVPIRVKVGWSSSVSAFLHQVQTQMIDMIPHEQAGLQNIRKISSEIDQASQFQTLLVVQPASNSTEQNMEDRLFEISLKEESDRRISELNSFTSYAIMWMCHVEEEGMDLSISFDSNVVPSTQVERMCKHFEHIVRALSSPSFADLPLRDLDLLSEQDLATIWTWNATVPPAQEKPLYELISESALKYPDSLAINAWDGQMTYSELDRISSQLASRLVALGARPKVTIPLHFEKSMWMPVAILAVLKSGSSFVQLSTALSTERMDAILNATQPLFALSSAKRQHGIPPHIKTYIVPDLLDDAGSSRIFYPPAYNPDAISNILFTSGSTGIPKGIKWSHRALSTNIRDAGKALSITQESHVFQFAAYDFDVSILESLSTLLHGACLCIPSEDERKNRLAESITHYNADTIFLTPSVSEILSPNSLPTLKTVIFGGEALSIQTVIRWADHVIVKNYYGPAECSSASHCIINPSKWTIGDIGQPDAVVFWVADPERHDVLVPIGAIGELLVEGPTLSSGFINKGHENTFVYPKWLEKGNTTHSGRRGRVYKTGDLVRQAVDGTFVYVGRKDAQVKVRGQRVELSEVESYLNRFITDGSNVSVAAEMVTPLGGSKPVLVAFLAIGDAANDDDQAQLRVASHTEGLMNNLASRLPAYMVPNAFIPVVSIPTTSTSKVNRRRLREIGATFSPDRLAKINSTPGNVHDKPRTATEYIIQKLWASVLRLDEDSIGLHDNFLVLGGDSIKAMQFVRTANEYGLHLAVTDVFLNPQLVDLASVATDKTNINEEFDIEAVFSSTKQQLIHSNILDSFGLSTDDLIQAFPVSDFQKFYVSALEEDTLEKFAHCYIDLPIGLEVANVVANCEKLWNHLDILRIVFIMVDGTPVQALFRNFSPSIDIHEVQGDLNEASEQIYREDFNRHYERGRPVTRFIVTHTQDGQIRLALRLSHAQFDGLSLACFLSTFSDFLNGLAPSENPSYANYVAHLTTTRGDGNIHWRSLLEGSQLSWPKWYSQSNAPTPANVQQEAIMLSRRVQAPQKYRHHTPSAIWSTICAYAIANVTESDDVVLGYLTTGRPCLSPGLQQMAGPCVNIVPLRVTLQEGDAFADSLSAVQKQRIAGFTRDSDQLSDIVENCTDWPSDTEHFGFGVHFLNIEDQLESKIDDSSAQLMPHTVKPAITFPTVILVARPRGVDEWEVEVRGGGDFHSKENLELFMENIITQMKLYG